MVRFGGNDDEDDQNADDSSSSSSQEEGEEPGGEHWSEDDAGGIPKDLRDSMSSSIRRKRYTLYSDAKNHICSIVFRYSCLT